MPSAKALLLVYYRIETHLCVAGERFDDLNFFALLWDQEQYHTPFVSLSSLFVYTKIIFRNVIQGLHSELKVDPNYVKFWKFF